MTDVVKVQEHDHERSMPAWETLKKKPRETLDERDTQTIENWFCDKEMSREVTARGEGRCGEVGEGRWCRSGVCRGKESKLRENFKNS